MKSHRITIHLFANLKEKAGTKRLELDIPEGCTVGTLKQILKQQIPPLGPQLANVVVLINKHNIYLDTDVIPLNAEVTFLPPIAGGR
jgi:molybdopterin converting factor small subunit